MNSVLEELFATAKVCDDGASYPLHSNLSAAEGEMLRRLIIESEPATTLEVGMAYGVSTLFICEALADLGKPARHLVMDPNQRSRWNGIGLRNVRQAGYDHLIEFHEEPSEYRLPRLVEEGTELDLAFIDGWHTFDQVMMEFYFINRMLRVGGVIVFDDANLPALQQVLRHVLTYPAYETIWNHPRPTGPPTILGRVRRWLGRSEEGGDIFRREMLSPAWELGIDRSLVSVRKVAKDERNWDWHREF